MNFGKIDLNWNYRRKQAQFLLDLPKTFHSNKVWANMDEKSNLQLKVSFILTGKYQKNLAFIHQFCNRTVKHKYKICFRVCFSEFQKQFEKVQCNKKTIAEL